MGVGWGWGAYRQRPETASTDAEVAQLAAAARSRAAANYIDNTYIIFTPRLSAMGAGEGHILI